MNKQSEHPQEFRTTIGGQALIEGILMRGPEKQAIVIRKPDGELETKIEELHLIKERHPILGVPLIRGAVNFLDSMVKGVKALMYSAEFYPEDEEEEVQPSKFETWLENKLGSEGLTKVIVALAVVLGIGFSVCLFILLPAFLGGLLQKVISSYLVCNLLEGVLRIAIFLAYLVLCSKQKDIRRVFCLPRGGASDHLLLREGVGADGGERPEHAPAPPPLRYQLPLCGAGAVHPALLHRPGGRHPAANGLQAAPAASAGGHRL